MDIVEYASDVGGPAVYDVSVATPLREDASFREACADTVTRHTEKLLDALPSVGDEHIEAAVKVLEALPGQALAKIREKLKKMKPDKEIFRSAVSHALRPCAAVNRVSNQTSSWQS